MHTESLLFSPEWPVVTCFNSNRADAFLSLSLQGVDVIINASSMDDIDPSAIGQRLTNGTAPIASPVLGRLRIRDEENPEQVVRDEIFYLLSKILPT